MTPEELLEMFSISPKEGGAIMFRACVWSMKDGMTAAEAVAHVCRTVHMPRPAVYSRMKRALAPIFEAEPSTLEALGLKSSRTTVDLAWELVRSMERG